MFIRKRGFGRRFSPKAWFLAGFFLFFRIKRRGEDRQSLIVENQHHKQAGGDVSIGQVENRGKKVENPVRPQRDVEEVELQHVHHFPLKERCIATGLRKQSGDRAVIIGIGEHTSVKNTIHHIAHRPGENQHGAQQEAERQFFPKREHFMYRPQDESGSEEAEKREQHLPYRAGPKDHTEGDSLIFNVMQAEPFAEHGHLLPEGKMGLHPHLQHLIGHYQQQNQQTNK